MLVLATKAALPNVAKITKRLYRGRAPPSITEEDEQVERNSNFEAIDTSIGTGNIVKNKTELRTSDVNIGTVVVVELTCKKMSRNFFGLVEKKMEGGGELCVSFTEKSKFGSCIWPEEEDMS